MDFFETATKGNLRTLLVLYLVIISVVVLWQWWSKRSAGLPMAYLFALTLFHFFGAWAHSFDYYTPTSAYLVQNDVGLQTTFLGFGATVIGTVGFVFGLAGVGMMVRRDPPQLLFRAYPQVTEKLPGTLLLISVLFFFVAGPLLRRVPSLGSMSTAGAFTSMLGMLLLIYQAYRRGQLTRFYGLMVSLIGFPIVTMVTMGFAGYGVNAAASVFVLVGNFFRPRWLYVITFVAALYIGLSGYVAYMQQRVAIRSQVWGGSGLGDRLQSIYGIVENFALFNPYKQAHLEHVDERVNLDDQAGKAIRYIASGNVDFARGGTFYVAAIAWVPRILWPNKPATGGSGSIVSKYTGVNFSRNTSVGVGQVMEFFINFGYPGVFWGFAILAGLLRWFDIRASYYFRQGDYWSYVRNMLPALGLISPGGISTELVGTLAANYVFVTIMHRSLFAQYYGAQVSHQRTLRGSRVGAA